MSTEKKPLEHRIIEVLRPGEVEPKHLLQFLKDTKVQIDPEIETVYGSIFADSMRAAFVQAARFHNGMAVVQVDPGEFRNRYLSLKRNIFGFDAKLRYGAVRRAALDSGLKSMDLLGALYFLQRFLQAGGYRIGTRFYIGCESFLFDGAVPSVLCSIVYDPYTGAKITAHDLTENLLLDVGVASGQGERLSSAFLFYLDQESDSGFKLR